jgi:phosphatidylglycerol:prolipoprotein diacylglycerol transferase
VVGVLYYSGGDNLVPVLFHIGSFAVRSYDVMVVLGMTVGLSLVCWRASRFGLSRARVLAGGIGIILVSLAGSRLGNVLIDLGYYVRNWREVFSLWGTGFQGALLTGIVATLVVARMLGISFWQLLDLFAPGVVLGQAIGRLGCFLNGCCYGRPTSSFLALYLPGWGADWAWRYPTQLMHSTANLLIAVVLLGVEKRKPFDGFLFLLYAILYSSHRLTFDFLRETGPLVSGVRATEIVSAATILTAGLILMWKWDRARQTDGRPEVMAG